MHLPIRVTEVLAALSLTTDLTAGVPFEKALRTCAVAHAFTGALGLAEAQRRTVFHAALLRSIGCTSHASENAAMFGDDMAFQAALKRLDPGDPAVFSAQLAGFGSWAGPASQGRLAARFRELAPTVGPVAARAGCEVSRALGPRLGLPAGAIRALDEVYERWDGPVHAHSGPGYTAALDEVRRGAPRSRTRRRVPRRRPGGALRRTARAGHPDRRTGRRAAAGGHRAVGGTGPVVPGPGRRGRPERRPPPGGWTARRGAR